MHQLCFDTKAQRHGESEPSKAISEGLPELYLAMKRAGASAEIHVFTGVGHGFGYAAAIPTNVSTWLDLFTAGSAPADFEARLVSCYTRPVKQEHIKWSRRMKIPARSLPGVT